jgi:hypothetical protein
MASNLLIKKQCCLFYHSTFYSHQYHFRIPCAKLSLEMSTRAFLKYYMSMLKTHLSAPLRMDYLTFQTYLVFFVKLQNLHSYAIRTTIRRATKVCIVFSSMFFRYWERSFLLKMRPKSRNPARISRFFRSEIILYSIKISYSEPASKTESIHGSRHYIRVLWLFFSFHG